MKKTILIVTIPLFMAAVLFSSLLLTGCKAETHSEAAAKTGQQYTCSMHPEVVQNAPGTCPKCDMKLIEKK